MQNNINNRNNRRVTLIKLGIGFGAAIITGGAIALAIFVPPTSVVTIPAIAVLGAELVGLTEAALIIGGAALVGGVAGGTAEAIDQARGRERVLVNQTNLIVANNINNIPVTNLVNNQSNKQYSPEDTEKLIDEVERLTEGEDIYGETSENISEYSYKSVSSNNSGIVTKYANDATNLNHRF